MPTGLSPECERLFRFLPRSQGGQAAWCLGLGAARGGAGWPRAQQGTEVSPASGTPRPGTTQHQEGGERRLRVQGLQRDKGSSVYQSRGCNMTPVCVKAGLGRSHSTSSGRHRL